MAKSSPFNAGGVCSIPGWEAKILHGSWPTATCRPVEDPDGGLHSEPAQEEAQDESELSLGLERTEGTLRMGVGELRVPQRE